MDCCHCQKTKHRSDEEQKRLTHRLNRIEGQVRGLKDMLQRTPIAPIFSFRYPPSARR